LKEKPTMGKQALNTLLTFSLPILLKATYSLLYKITEKKSAKLPEKLENTQPIQNILLY
jgi:hypothetical protein